MLDHIYYFKYKRTRLSFLGMCTMCSLENPGSNRTRGDERQVHLWEAAAPEEPVAGRCDTVVLSPWLEPLLLILGSGWEMQFAVSGILAPLNLRKDKIPQRAARRFASYRTSFHDSFRHQEVEEYLCSSSRRPQAYAVGPRTQAGPSTWITVLEKSEWLKISVLGVVVFNYKCFLELWL